MHDHCSECANAVAENEKLLAGTEEAEQDLIKKDLAIAELRKNLAKAHKEATKQSKDDETSRNKRLLKELETVRTQADSDTHQAEAKMRNAEARATELIAERKMEAEREREELNVAFRKQEEVYRDKYESLKMKNKELKGSA